MRKLLAGLIFSTLLGCASTMMNGYDGFARGTSVEEVKKKYPDLSDITGPNTKKLNLQDCLCKESDKVFKMFSFYKNSLCSGKIFYCDPPHNIIEILTNKLKDTYGEPTLIVKTKFDGRDEIGWYYTETFLISFKFIDPAYCSEMGDFNEVFLVYYCNANITSKVFKNKN